jgi:citrate synthase
MHRVAVVANHVAGKDTLTVTDNRSGKSIEVKIKDSTIPATDFKTFGLKTYDPGYMGTICCTSKVSFIDGGKGILRYRGIPIEQLAEKSTYPEVSFLLTYGELPTKDQLVRWEKDLMRHAVVNADLEALIKTFRYNAHPVGMLVSIMAAMGTLYPESNPALAGQGIYKDRGVRNKEVLRIIGSATTVSAMCYRHRMGLPFIQPNPDLGYTENFLYMMDCGHEGPSYKPNPVLVQALDILFMLHAEHELNCSTSAMRHLASSNVDVYTAASAATGALYGPRHGGANEAVLRMLVKIGSVDKIPEFIKNVKEGKEKLMGFGHRVYKNFDPRAKIVRTICDKVFAVTGKEPLLDVAMELEKIALSDEYFIKRKLYPNVDFYSGLIYKAMGFPTDMFTVLFAIPRFSGWLAHWQEWTTDPENRIYRPFQNYQGYGERAYDAAKSATPVGGDATAYARGSFERRRDVSLSDMGKTYK